MMNNNEEHQKFAVPEKNTPAKKIGVDDETTRTRSAVIRSRVISQLVYRLVIRVVLDDETTRTRS